MANAASSSTPGCTRGPSRCPSHGAAPVRTGRTARVTRMPASYDGTFVWNSAAVPAADGELRTDSRNWSGAAQLSFGTHDATGRDATRLWQAMQAADTIHVQQANNSSNWSDYSLTASPIAQGDGSWLIAVSRSGGTGQASNGQDTSATFTVASATSARQCTEYDVDGYKQHQAPVGMQSSSSAIGPSLAWCQYCHEVFVAQEP